MVWWTRHQNCRALHGKNCHPISSRKKINPWPSDEAMVGQTKRLTWRCAQQKEVTKSNQTSGPYTIAGKDARKKNKRDGMHSPVCMYLNPYSKKTSKKLAVRHYGNNSAICSSLKFLLLIKRAGLSSFVTLLDAAVMIRRVLSSCDHIKWRPVVSCFLYRYNECGRSETQRWEDRLSILHFTKDIFVLMFIVGL